MQAFVAKESRTLRTPEDEERIGEARSIVWTSLLRAAAFLVVDARAKAAAAADVKRR